MTERGQMVVQLLRSRWDWLPGLRTATGLIVEGSAKRGEVASTWVECQRCGGRKSVGQGRAERPCDRCGGEGRVRVDPMIERDRSKSAIVRERVTGEAESVRLRRRATAGELRRLELADLHRQGKIGKDEKEAWERAKSALYASGSFAELDRALALLERTNAYGRAALEVVYGYDAPLRIVGAALQEAADRAVEQVASWMPSSIRVPERPLPVANGTGRWANGEAQRLRDREIWRLHTVEGLNREQIAKRLGIDRSTVSRVLAAKVAA